MRHLHEHHVQPRSVGMNRPGRGIGVDHALSPTWLIGGQLGASRTRLRRHQVADEQVSDTTVRAHGSTAALALTHFPNGDLFIDTTLAFQRTSLRNDRHPIPRR